MLNLQSHKHIDHKNSFYYFQGFLP